MCVPCLNNIPYSSFQLEVCYKRVVIQCDASVRKNTVSQLGFLVLCFKPKTGGSKGGKVWVTKLD